MRAGLLANKPSYKWLTDIYVSHHQNTRWFRFNVSYANKVHVQCIIFIIKCIIRETSSSLHMCHGTERIHTQYVVYFDPQSQIHTHSIQIYKYAKLSISDIQQTIHEEALIYFVVGCCYSVLWLWHITPNTNLIVHFIPIASHEFCADVKFNSLDTKHMKCCVLKGTKWISFCSDFKFSY